MVGGGRILWSEVKFLSHRGRPDAKAFTQYISVNQWAKGRGSKTIRYRCSPASKRCRFVGCVCGVGFDLLVFDHH